MTQLSQHEIESIADKAAEKAVMRVLLTLGIDASDPEAIQKTQRDFAHLRDWRLSIAAAKKKGFLTIVGVLVSGTIGLVWLAVTKGH